MKKINFNGVKIETNPDSRNYHIAQFVPGKDEIKTKSFMLNLPELDVIINQSQYNACVGHSFATAKSILEYNHTNKWIDFDPFVIYGTRAKGDYSGEGMFSWQAAKTLLKEGAYFRRDFNIQQEMPDIKYTVEKWKAENADKVEAAKNYTISGYSYINTIDEFKRALINKMPISVTYPIYASFYSTGDDGKVKRVDSYDKLQGYHQMTVVGWTNDNYWIVINSWGSNYGMKGMYFIPFSYPFDNAIAISDTITPSTYKARNIELMVNSSDYLVDGNSRQFDVKPYIKNDRTLVPIRFISEALGASVEWVDESREVIIRSEEANIKLKINSTEVEINGRKMHNDVAPEIRNDRTMLPIRLIAESLNCKVTWLGGLIRIKAL